MFLVFCPRQDEKGVWCRGGVPRLLGRVFANGGGLEESRWNRKCMDPGLLVPSQGFGNV